MHHWQYFYNSSLLMRSFGNPEAEEPVEHREELVAILEAFGQALLQPDVNIFRQSLQSLEQLNARCRLYQRAIFKSNLLERFLAALFTVLFQRCVENFSSLHQGKNFKRVNINSFPISDRTTYWQTRLPPQCTVWPSLTATGSSVNFYPSF